MSNEENYYTVGEVAEIYQLTRRTLRHWEEIGLLEVPDRTWSNYRLYGPDEMARIEQILIYRATGMPLQEINHVLENNESRAQHLKKQRTMLVNQQQGLAVMIAAIDELLEGEMADQKLTNEEIGKILGDAGFAAKQAEAAEMYQDTDDWAITQQRTASWDKADWEGAKDRFSTVETRLAQAVRDGIAADSDEACTLAEEHREMLSTFYPVTHAKHVLLSQGYVADERFRAHYENLQPGLAEWLKDAIAANARAHGVDPENVEWA